MKKSLLLVLVGVFTLLFAQSAFAQDQTKKVTYEVTIMGLTCDGDAAKIDQMMLSKKGIFSSSTSFSSKRTKVTVDHFVSIEMLRHVIVASGFEMSEENISKSEQN